jgi:hypothetical protein
MAVAMAVAVAVTLLPVPHPALMAVSISLSTHPLDVVAATLARGVPPPTTAKEAPIWVPPTLVQNGALPEIIPSYMILMFLLLHYRKDILLFHLLNFLLLTLVFHQNHYMHILILLIDISWLCD